jgi:hypothetical protein
MTTDKYTKAVLTVIAAMLTALACSQYVSPAATAQAQGPFAGVQVSGNSGMFSTFDSRTGDMWIYFTNVDGDGPLPRAHVKLSAPGAPASISYLKK